MPAVLNLSNEVVKMRAEVKRVKVFLIRKLSRQISALQKKKGSDADLEKFRRRAARLREEIHELKVVPPDTVTKAALQKEINFEKVCRDKEASLTDRATARIATHPQFSKKIQSIKAAIKAFKDERINERKAEKQVKKNAENDTSNDQPQEDNDEEVGSEKSNNEDDDDQLEEAEDDKKTDEEQKLIDSSSHETLNEQNNQCRKEKSLSVEDSSEALSIPQEVIRMRKEVKRTRVAIISKMAEEVAFLKKKKGEESEVKESQERVAEILKEIQALRTLKPDQVTMLALQENIELEKNLQDTQASPMDRAIAHIATHSRFINKLQKVKEAIKEEKMKAAEAEKKKADKLEMMQSKNEEEEHEEDEEQEDDDDESDNDSEEDNDIEDKKPNIVTSKIDESGAKEPTKSTESDAFEMPPSKSEVMLQNAQLQKSTEKLSTPIKVQRSPEKSSTPPNVQRSYEKSSAPLNVQISPEKSSAASSDQSSSEKSSIASNVPETSLTVSRTESENISKADKETKTTLKSQKKQNLAQTTRLEVEKDDEESDLSDEEEEEEEKEYFDDSTEERFHKQSSQSEDSDDDDFFLGKVSKFKKRKSKQTKVVEKKSELLNPDQEGTSKPHNSLGKLESVFCSTLSKSNVSSQKAKYGSQNDGSRPPRFQNQKKGPEGRMKASQYKARDLGSDKRSGTFKPDRQTFKAGGQRQAGPSGAGRGKPQFEHRQNQNPKGPPGKMSNPPQQSLHPSWEASRKRKEQQAQITVFQGKKIRFDDDDD